MSEKAKTLICILLLVPSYFWTHTFFHESGHALVILAYGGTVDHFSFWNINAHVSTSDAMFTTFGAALCDISGMLLPTIIGAIAIAFYKAGIKFAGYHLCYLTVVLGLVASMIVWVVMPIASVITPLPRGVADDVLMFLDATNFHPIFVSLAVLVFAGAFMFLAYAKGILTKATFQRIKEKL